MKIGIMTFWWSNDNYGQILQCYALQKYLRNMGHDAFLIRYHPGNDFVKTPFWRKVIKAFNPIELINYLVYKEKLNNLEKEKKNNPRYFNDFREKYIKQSEKIYYSYQELANDPPEADIYITGSDQIWNPDLLKFKNTKNQTKAYFLDFVASGKKRIAYAASFGKKNLPDDFINEISPLLKKFDYVSVREESGVDICRQCGVDTAEWVSDPVMLLDVNDYRVLYSGEQMPETEQSYCFVYMLSNTCDFSMESVNAWAKTKNLAVVYVTANSHYDNYRKVYATIPEWLYLLDNAEYIITNSFHCSLFSLFFRKELAVIPLTEKYTEMNSRFDSLFEILDIEKRFTDNSFDVFDKLTDWDKIDDKWQKMNLFTTNIKRIIRSIK
jgi:hypothetical protein